MKTILKSPAKINLTLDILGQDRISGYHFIQSIMQEIPWIYDEIEIEIQENSTDAITEISPLLKHVLDCDRGGVGGIKNTIWQAVEIMRRETGRLENVYIKVKKNIPMQSGLGGASSNAATILKFLNKFWKLKKSRKILSQLGAEIGMDVSFFIYGGTCFARHFGEEIEPLPNLKIEKKDIEIIFTGINVSTKEAYEKIPPAPFPARMDSSGWHLKGEIWETEKIIQGIKNKEPLQNLTQYFHNDFEEFAFQKPEFQEFFKKNNLNTKNTRLCGSGGALFTY